MMRRMQEQQLDTKDMENQPLKEEMIHMEQELLLLIMEVVIILVMKDILKLEQEDMVDTIDLLPLNVSSFSHYLHLIFTF